MNGFLVFVCNCPLAGVVAVKDPVPLSPLEPSAAADTEQSCAEKGSSSLINDLQPHCVSMETPYLPPLTPKAEDGLEEDDEGGGALTISELAYRSLKLHKHRS